MLLRNDENGEECELLVQIFRGGQLDMTSWKSTSLRGGSEGKASVISCLLHTCPYESSLAAPFPFLRRVAYVYTHTTHIHTHTCFVSNMKLHKSSK